MGVSTEDFVMIWQGSASREEVVRRTGYTYNYASQRAARLRATVAPTLKHFRRKAAAVEVPDPEVARGMLALADADASGEATDTASEWG